MTRSLSVIAADIIAHWPKPYFGAMPYLGAMLNLDSIDDMFGADSAKSIVRYFLSNATRWKGPEANRLKRELRELAGVK